MGHLTTTPATTIDGMLAGILALAREQAHAARVGDWDTVNDLAARRDELTANLSAAETLNQPADAARERIAELFSAIKASDDEVTALVRREIERLAREMAEIRRGRAAASAYAREAGGARYDLVCRYG
ncbi:flagellar protein FliT [Sphaerobacter thermophilus]|jgi:uncharacterized coiled-coil DUF342 family protein|uniref:Flagellar protein FliT n=1 Tax=Sphaerobacter thermophilus (strain ATCC 49802 / DSM 20745 / KCCM 41009 / NCIMB 13125 / S 6022) TaxID=479434 RepID=D1C175_SPHTD|nr:flagellar protein FliT [Sphaerobacter thermophilus]ACZ37992.1 hypothetical protein Sthe_0554 [Sphaerobacter thermophilus DSM 20745]PZN62896.1 MAG: flagellar protein FliT [Sphaerobacter thermophilus]